MKKSVLLMLAALAVGACEQPHSQEHAKTEDERVLPDVTQTIELAAATAAHRLDGVAMILNPDSLLQIDADLTANRISADFSTATAGRYKSTGSLSRQIIENAERQAGIDGTQRSLLESRMRQTWGDGAPFLDAAARAPLIARLSAGSEALVRIDFPELTSGIPQAIALSPLTGGASINVKKMWPAPTGNLAMPGVSFFALIDTAPGLRPGDRARATADNPKKTDGVMVPSAAIVVFAGQSWCFIETAPGHYERRAVALAHPTEDGFLVSTGFKVGERVVVRGASTLLSREAGPGEGDDDDDRPSTAGAKQVKQIKPTPGPTSKARTDDDDDKPVLKGAPTANATSSTTTAGGAEAREAKSATAAPQAAKRATAATTDDDDDKPAKQQLKAGGNTKPANDRD